MANQIQAEQGTEAWHTHRLGWVTGSRLSEVMAKTKSGYSASRDNYMMELLCQRLTGKREESFSSQAMQRGIEKEPIARGCYEAQCGVMVIEATFCKHDKIDWFGATPDGFVGSDGLLEIKCPNTKQHVDFLRTGKPDGKYQWQMLCQMECTGRKWCDFVSFDDRMPTDLQFAVTRFHRDDDRISEMVAEVKKFIGELNSLETEMRSKLKQEKAA
jgi:putative phage-type endonuclease